MISIPTFRTVSIGNEHVDLSHDLRSAGVYLDRVARSIVATLGAAQPMKRKAETALVTPRDLGFSPEDVTARRYARFKSLSGALFFERARDFGLIKCGEIVAPELLLQYADYMKQVGGRWVRVYMNPLSGGPSNCGNRLFSFGVGRNGLSLATSDNCPAIQLSHAWLFEKSG